MNEKKHVAVFKLRMTSIYFTQERRRKEKKTRQL